LGNISPIDYLIKTVPESQMCVTRTEIVLLSFGGIIK